MSPNTHTDKADGNGSEHHDRVAENGFAREHRNDFRSESEGWEYQDIDFRVAKDPEEVHPDHGGTAGLGVEEMRSKIPVDQQHDLRCGERTHRKNYQAGHH